MRKSATYRLVVPLLACLLFVSCEWCHKPDPTPKKLRRTVLVYIAAENSLAYGNFPDLDQKEMESAIGDVPSDCRLVVFIDDTDLPHIYSWEKDKSGTMVKTELYSFPEDCNSASSSVLHDVVYYVEDKYPSDSYGLILWSHGRAWLPAAASAPSKREGFAVLEAETASLPPLSGDPLQRSFGVDNGENSYSNKGSRMDISDMASALEGFPKFDFIFFDACFMQAVEVAWDLRNVTHWLIGSPAEIPGPGAPYEKLIIPMFLSEGYAEGIVDAYYRGYADECVPLTSTSSDCFGVVLSAIDCSKMEALRQATSNIIVKYMSSSINDNVNGVQHYFPYTATDIPYYFDMLDYMRNVVPAGSDLQSWERAFFEAVPVIKATDSWYSAYSYSLCPVDLENCGAVSCYVPLNGKVFSQLNEWFRRTDWYKAASWSEVGW